MRLEGKGAVITGGGRGIGAAIARDLAARGARVIVCARSGGEIEAVAAKLRDEGHDVSAVACDVVEHKQVLELKTEALARLETVDILVNNAGVATSAALKAIRLYDWNLTLAVNVTGTFLCTQAFLPDMVERGWGRVVNVASIAGRMGAPYIAAYAASKHAVVGFTRSIAAEVAAHGVTVNAVCPGYVDTPMTDESVARIIAKTGAAEDKVRKHLREQSPQHRLMEAEEVAYLVSVLCDPRSRGINGQAIVLDGGAVQG